jgi:hypothetical protein
LGVGAKGRVYFGYIGGDGHPHISVSDDQGRSWHNDLDVGVPYAIRNAAFPEVVAGDNDRASFFFLGTPSAGDATGADTGTPFDGVWHGYLALHTTAARIGSPSTLLPPMPCNLA